MSNLIIIPIDENKKINYLKLKAETETMFPELDRVETGFSNSVEFHFNTEFSGESSDLENLINAHNGEVYPFKLTNRFDTQELLTIDYDILGLHKQRIITKGELREIKYYRNYDQVNYTDLVIKEIRRYIRNPATGLLVYRLLNIYWYNTNDEVGFSVQNRAKHYTFQESREEMKIRRTNIIADAEKYLLYLLIQNAVTELGVEQGQPAGFIQSLEFLGSVKFEKDYYIDGIGQPLENAISNATQTYMTQTIKDTILDIITYDYTQND